MVVKMRQQGRWVNLFASILFTLAALRCTGASPAPNNGVPKQLVGPLLGQSSAAQVPDQSVSRVCDVRVTEPHPGQEVASDITVEGTATLPLPPNHHLWVFARRESYRMRAVWWPQDKALVDSGTGRWKVPATLGRPKDIGWNFDVVAAVFSPEQDMKLQDYIRKSMAAIDYQSIEMPDAACVAKQVTVMKIRE